MAFHKHCGIVVKKIANTYIDQNDKVLRMTKLGLAMERKLYITKLREIEKYLIQQKDQSDKDPFLRQVKQILYEESPDFKRDTSSSKHFT